MIATPGGYFLETVAETSEATDERMITSDGERAGSRNPLLQGGPSTQTRRTSKRPTQGQFTRQLQGFLDLHAAQMRYLNSGGQEQVRESEQALDSKARKEAIAARQHLEMLFELIASVRQEQEVTRAADHQVLERSHQGTQNQLKEAERQLKKIREEREQETREQRELWRSRKQPEGAVPVGGNGGKQPPRNPSKGNLGGDPEPSDDDDDDNSEWSHGRKNRRVNKGGVRNLAPPGDEDMVDSLAKIPFEFHNTRKHNLRHWLMECEIYFEQKPKKFRTDRNKVLFAGTYTSGLAKEWFMEYIETKMLGPVAADYATWARFRQEVMKRFLSTQEAMENAVKMQQFKYSANIGHPTAPFAPSATERNPGAPLTAHESYQEQMNMLAKAESKGKESNNDGSSRQKDKGFKIKGRAQSEEKEKGRAKKNTSTDKLGNKPVFHEYDEATKGGHLWKWCRSDANSSVSISSFSRKRTRDDDGDDDMEPAEPQPQRKRMRHRARKPAAAEYTSGQAFVREHRSESEMDFDMGFQKGTSITEPFQLSGV
ncbi:uncharacterized protein H6S33_007208 [Morchella sextelata]|uniref:uncharacterized protein n=1 Tax=Morchella sextelata TaxID=1174677 RepID=UPI001D0531BB|nr:uncharacterized protein H6S33_007208 [Morchella sextelata]KAH0604177.1 hypothetical protein H6S33_007208 [Morchella sextelata]